MHILLIRKVLIVGFTHEDGTSVRYPNDNVTGYISAVLVSVLRNMYGINGVKQTLKNNKPSGLTDVRCVFYFYSGMYDEAVPIGEAEE